jgi:hypothetical protein
VEKIQEQRENTGDSNASGSKSSVQEQAQSTGVLQNERASLYLLQRENTQQYFQNLGYSVGDE